MEEPIALCTWLLIVTTGVVSFLAFRDQRLEAKYIFRPDNILAEKEYYRLLTSGFLHAGWSHLIWNMVGLYFFGPSLEAALGGGRFMLIYLGAIVGGNLLSLYVHRHHDYQAYGASGGVCGVIFAYLLLFPGARIALYFIMPLPGWLYAVGFMVGAFVALQRARDNIGHDAHLGGAIVGLLITAALEPRAVTYNWKIFAIVLGLSTALLVYLWINPLFLPVPAFFGKSGGSRNRNSAQPKHKQEALQVDAILEKIAKSGAGSLTPQEKALLEEVSGRMRRRGESQKPKMDLPI